MNNRLERFFGVFALDSMIKIKSLKALHEVPEDPYLLVFPSHTADDVGSAEALVPDWFVYRAT